MVDYFIHLPFLLPAVRKCSMYFYEQQVYSHTGVLFVLFRGDVLSGSSGFLAECPGEGEGDGDGSRFT